MRGNIFGIFFSILSGVLIVLIVLAYGRSDRVEPEFRFSSVDYIYDSGTTDEDLMIGINAYDTVDGNLSDRIVVEKVVLNKEKETAVVYYAVADYSGNVAKQSRVFPADIKDIENNGEIIEDGEGPLFENMLTEDGQLIQGEQSETVGQTDETSEASSLDTQTRQNQSGN